MLINLRSPPLGRPISPSRPAGPRHVDASHLREFSRRKPLENPIRARSPPLPPSPPSGSGSAGRWLTSDSDCMVIDSVPSTASRRMAREEWEGEIATLRLYFDALKAEQEKERKKVRANNRKKRRARIQKQKGSILRYVSGFEHDHHCLCAACNAARQ